ncbi:MAG: DUF456 domain-containing protein [Planctomycetota bacterium]
MEITPILVATSVVLVCSISVVMTIVRLPGTWLILATAFGLGWYTSWREVGALLIAILAALAIIGELLETLLSAAVARRAGASRHAMIGGMIGSLVGLILFSCLIPIPIIGSFLGALLGCFLGAVIGENWKKRRLNQSAKVGMAAAWGFLLGAGAKTMIGVVMACVVVASAVTLCKQGTPNSPDPIRQNDALPNHQETP